MHGVDRKAVGTVGVTKFRIVVTLVARCGGMVDGGEEEAYEEGEAEHGCVTDASCGHHVVVLGILRYSCGCED